MRVKIYASILASLAISACGRPGTANTGKKESSSNLKLSDSQSAEKLKATLIAHERAMLESSLALMEVDDVLFEAREQSKAIRALNSTGTNVLEQLHKLSETVDQGVVKLNNLQAKLLSHYNAVKDSAPIQDAEHIARRAKLLDLFKTRLAKLSGMKNVLLAQYNDLLSVDHVRQSLAKSESPNNHGPLPNVVPSTPMAGVPTPPNPIVSNFANGGKVSGSVTDAASGSIISNARVGFKHYRESTKYFAETTTNSSGHYESPHLLPGQYFIDVIAAGRVAIQNRPVTIELGNTTSENLAPTVPLVEGQWRIVMSWTAPKQGAVRDVDSYLAIPTVETPIYFSNKADRHSEANLDRDDTDWEGPETVTINSMRMGTYTYYVDNYSDRLDRKSLGNSNIKIEVYKGSELKKSYSVPPGEGLTYEVFKITNGQLVDVEKWNETLATSRKIFR